MPWEGTVRRKRPLILRERNYRHPTVRGWLAALDFDVTDDFVFIQFGPEVLLRFASIVDVELHQVTSLRKPLGLDLDSPLGTTSLRQTQ